MLMGFCVSVTHRPLLFLMGQHFSSWVFVCTQIVNANYCTNMWDFKHGIEVEQNWRTVRSMQFASFGVRILFVCAIWFENWFYLFSFCFVGHTCMFTSAQTVFLIAIFFVVNLNGFPFIRRLKIVVYDGIFLEIHKLFGHLKSSFSSYFKY